MVPHVAALLIAQDYNNVPFVRAYSTMVASSDAGALIHPADDDDAELEEIFRWNLMAHRSNRLEILTSEGDVAQALLELQRQTKKVLRVP